MHSPERHKPVKSLVRSLFCGFVILVALLPVAVFAQQPPCDFEKLESCEPVKSDDAVAEEWPGPTLRARIRLYGSFESIDPPDLAMEDGRQNDAYMRRADLTFRGDLLKDIGYYFKAEFNEAELDIRDLYLSHESDLGLFMLGLVDPIDEAVDPAYREFMESSAMEDFAPGNQLGLGYFRDGENWLFFAGAFKNKVDRHKIEETGVVYSTRFTIAPHVPEGYLLHIGGYASWRQADKDEELFRYRVTSMLRTGENYLDTGEVADEEGLVGLELGLSIGSTSFDGQCAVVRASVPQAGEPDSYLDGCYISGIWTITGEKRYYGGDGFTLLRVKTSVFDGGPGAWQVGARYDTIDLSDGVIQGGGQNTSTYSLVWYLNGQLWLSANYSRATFENHAFAGDETNGWGTRIQYLFEW